MAQKIEIPIKASVKTISLTIGILGLALCLWGWFADAQQFSFSYLTAFVFWLSIALGGLFLTILHNLVGAVWSVVIRRLFETLASLLPLMILFFLPILFGMHELYDWSHPDAVAGDALLHEKTAYLNVPFFVIRAALFFIAWALFSRFYYRNSIENDRTGDSALIARARKLSPVAVIVFALTLTFASFDWLMSLDAHWYSTIYGVYYFSGCMVALLSTLTLLVLYFDKTGPLKGLISIEHYHDLGKLLFTFTVFWAYIAFSQYFLIWYANIPEETVWFAHHWVGSWKTVTLLLVAGHFVIPFFLLIVRAVKRSNLALLIMSFWLLLMHWLDMYWLVMPNLHHQNAHFSWMDAAAMAGIGGIFVRVFYGRLTKHSLIPYNDPKLDESIKHRL
jgi:hypothetical protein